MAFFTWVSLPLIIGVGIVLFLCLVITATLGSLIMKGKTRIPFSWHVTLARLTIALALIHGFLVMAWFNGW